MFSSKKEEPVNRTELQKQDNDNRTELQKQDNDNRTELQKQDNESPQRPNMDPNARKMNEFVANMFDSSKLTEMEERQRKLSQHLPELRNLHQQSNMDPNSLKKMAELSVVKNESEKPSEQRLPEQTPPAEGTPAKKDLERNQPTSTSSVFDNWSTWSMTSEL